MEKDVRELVEKELVNLKTQIVLQEVQLDALNSGKYSGDMAQSVAKQQQQISANLEFNKGYAVKLETLLGGDKPEPTPKPK